MDINYTWIYWQGKICRQFGLLIWTSLIGQIILLVRGGGGIQLVGGSIVIAASREYYFIRVHENLMQHPSNNISIWIVWLRKYVHMYKLFLASTNSRYTYSKAGNQDVLRILSYNQQVRDQGIVNCSGTQSLIIIVADYKCPNFSTNNFNLQKG